jgi:NAD(P)-dependent dehydrogenase (short-subunit alcohol dehydrogenase family)
VSRFAGKVALITGSDHGIGRATALRLADEGAAVVVLDVDRAAAEDTTTVLSRGGARALAIEADITKAAAVRHVIEQTLEAFGQIDVLVNNAARTAKANLAQTSPEDWPDEIEGTLTGAFLVSPAVLAPMVARAATARSSASAR